MDKKNEDAQGKIKTVLAFAEKTKSDLADTAERVNKIPYTIEEVKEDLQNTKKDIADHQSETGEHSKLTDSILSRLSEVEHEASSIKFLKDKSVAASELLEEMKKDFGQQLKDLGKNEALLSKVRDNSVVMEKRLSTQIITTRDSLDERIQREAHEIRKEVKDVEDKTERVVKEVMENSGGGRGGSRKTRVGSDMSELSGGDLSRKGRGGGGVQSQAR